MIVQAQRIVEQKKAILFACCTWLSIVAEDEKLGGNVSRYFDELKSDWLHA